MSLVFNSEYNRKSIINTFYYYSNNIGVQDLDHPDLVPALERSKFQTNVCLIKLSRQTQGRINLWLLWLLGVCSATLFLLKYCGMKQSQLKSVKNLFVFFLRAHLCTGFFWGGAADSKQHSRIQAVDGETFQSVQNCRGQMGGLARVRTTYQEHPRAVRCRVFDCTPAGSSTAVRGVSIRLFKVSSLWPAHFKVHTDFWVELLIVFICYQVVWSSTNVKETRLAKCRKFLLWEMEGAEMLEVVEPSSPPHWRPSSRTPEVRSDM